MSFTEALVQAHSEPETEAALVEQILAFLDDIEKGSRDDIALASLRLRESWNISVDEIEDLFDYVDEFRAEFSRNPEEEPHQEAC